MLDIAVEAVVLEVQVTDQGLAIKCFISVRSRVTYLDHVYM